MAVRVVIAEDEWLAAAVLRHELEQQGYEVVSAVGTGSEAFDACCAQTPDLVMMDVQMPGMDGIGATRAVMEKCPTCVVIITGKARLEEAAERAGAMSCVLKPLLGNQISPVVEIARHRFAHFMAVRTESATPQAALEDWQVVMRAVKLLVGRDTITEDEAFHRLQRRARESETTLQGAAAELLNGLLGPSSNATALATH